MPWAWANHFVLECWAAFVVLLAVANVRAWRARKGGAETRDHRSMAGLFLQALGAALVFSGVEQAPGEWRLWTACLLAPLSALLAWRGAIAMGRHFRASPVVTEDHELVTSGPFALVRHPI